MARAIETSAVGCSPQLKVWLYWLSISTIRFPGRSSLLMAEAILFASSPPPAALPSNGWATCVERSSRFLFHCVVFSRLERSRPTCQRPRRRQDPEEMKHLSAASTVAMKAARNSPGRRWWCSSLHWDTVCIQPVPRSWRKWSAESSTRMACRRQRKG